MMDKLGVTMIFANSSQAKGRVERYNGTAQMRLPNDLIRWKIPHNYDFLNDWFNRKYRLYLNMKFSYPVKDLNDLFRPIHPLTSTLRKSSELSIRGRSGTTYSQWETVCIQQLQAMER